MLFSSLFFLWCFLPFVFIGTTVISKRSNKATRNKNTNRFLLGCSLFFYAWGGIYYLLIMLSSIVINYYGAGFVNKKGLSNKVRKRNLILVITLNLLILFVFKYFNMLVIIIESLLPGSGKGLWHSVLYLEGTGELGIIKIVLPIGISFFTFQSMSYVIDVYKGDADVQTSILDFALYVSFFPQLIAGPIVKYTDIEQQLHKRKRSSADIVEGQRRFSYGLAKKVIFANTFGNIADQIWALDISKLGSAVAWLGMIMYSLQIYYDFSGYSDMAIGIGKMLGFSFKENFNHPYTALSVQDFWRRWHISLSSWFKEYVYIPLGGNRRGIKRTCLNTFIVFLLTGIWHGANFTFIYWGVTYAILLILERLFLGKWLSRNPIKPINWIYTIFIVMTNWVMFRSDNIAQGLTFIGQLFSGRSSYTVLSYLSMEVIFLFVLAVLLSGFLQKILKNRIATLMTNRTFIKIDFSFQLILLFICVLKLISGTYNAFIYFQF